MVVLRRLTILWFAALFAVGCGAPSDGGEGLLGEVSEATTTVNVLDPAVFNWRFYLDANPDLLQAGIVTPAAAASHWENFGIRECRRAHPLFHTSQYLALYPDLQRAFGSDCTLALQHYLTNGRYENRVGVFDGIFGGRATASNGTITIGASQRTAGAIDSLYWSGHEFVNAYDHGRELQTALTTNDRAECYNPTEAGSRDDATKTTTTSDLDAWWVNGSVLATQSRAAFWLAPGETSTSCVGPATNTSPLSNYQFNTQATVGYQGDPQVVQFLTQVTVPEYVDKLQIEAPTGYLGGEFSCFYQFSPATCARTQIGAGPGEQGLPLILALPDGSAAMGVWAPGLPEAAYPGAGFGRAAALDPANPASSTTKWTVVYRTGPLAAGTVLHYQALIFVGTLDQVENSMCNMLRPTIRLPLNIRAF